MKKYPNLQALNEIYNTNLKLALELVNLDTSSELGTRIAESLNWLFTEDKIQALPLLSIYAQAKEIHRVHRETSSVRDGSNNAYAISWAIEEACKNNNIPVFNYYNFEDYEDSWDPDLDLVLPEGFEDNQVGDVINIDGATVRVLLIWSNQRIISAPADMIIWQEADRPKLAAYEERSLTPQEVQANADRARQIHEILTQA